MINHFYDQYYCTDSCSVSSYSFACVDGSGLHEFNVQLFIFVLESKLFVLMVSNRKSQTFQC